MPGRRLGLRHPAIRIGWLLVQGGNVVAAKDIDALRVRLSAAGTVADTLVVAWDIFELVQVVANGCAGREPSLFAAFLFTAAAAAEGRDAAGFAPSIPDVPGISVDQPEWEAASTAEIAGQVAGLMTFLGRRLELAAGQAADPEDRQACAHAARQVGQIRALLAPGGR
jgi:hypothetical protein